MGIDATCTDNNGVSVRQLMACLVFFFLICKLLYLFLKLMSVDAQCDK